MVVAVDNSNSLQQQNSKRENVLKFLRIFIHGSALAFFGISVYCHPIKGDIPAHLTTNKAFLTMTEFPGKWKYLTTWDVVLQISYHFIALVNDIWGSSGTNPSKQTKLQKMRDAVFASWAFPIGLFVTSTFWTLYAINRQLVFPKELDEFYPMWLNHAVHTSPAVLLFLDLITTPKVWPQRCGAIGRNLGFTAVYLAWITWVYTQNGSWAYPVLNVLNNWQRALFFGTSFLCSLGYYFLGEALTRCIWGAKSNSSDDSSPSSVTVDNAA